MKNILIVIPSYEPDERLIKLCNDLYDNDLNEIIIVNDGSSKEYDYIFKEIQEKYNCKILEHKKNLGKGRGLKNAFNYILTHYNDVIGCVTADSDGQHSVKDIQRLMKELENNPDDLILGCRDFNKENVPFKSKFGNKITKNILALFCGVKVSDTQTGLRAIPKKMMQDLLDTEGERFEFETNMLIESKGKYNIKEVRIETIYDSKENHSTHFNPIVDSMKIYKSIFKVFFKYIFASFSSFAIDILLFDIFCKLIGGVNQSYYIIVATILARIISSIYNYVINHKLVFNSNQQIKKTAIKYFLLVILQMGLSAILVQALFNIANNCNETLIKILIDTILFFINFFVQKMFIFKK